MRDLLAILLVLGAAAYLARRAVAGQGGTSDDGPSTDPWPDFGGSYIADETDQSPSTFESAIVIATPSTYTPANVGADQAQRNLRACLDAIAFAEGTAGPDGYRTMFGYRYFDSFADHPRQYFPFTNGRGEQLKSSAAGRYQIIVRTWDGLQRKLGLQDFAPASQEAAAVELIRERGALNDAMGGRFAEFARKCAPTWASLPGAGYAQPERSLQSLIAAYRNAGGTLEA